MKKIYFLTAVVLSASAVNAQQNYSVLSASKKGPFSVKAAKPVSNIEKTEGDVIYSNNFSTPSDWAISNAGAPTHTSGDWAIVNAMPGSLTSQIPTYGFPGAMSSASGGNFALVNSDAAGNGALQDAYLTTAAGIDVATLLSNAGSAANTPLYLKFTEIYRHYQESFFVAISNNGGTSWTEFQVNTEAEVPVNTNSGDPEFETVNITPAIGGGNWGSDVRIRFRYQGTYDWFWGVDDVQLVEAWQNDIKVVEFHQATDITTTQAVDYYMVPTSQSSFPGLTFGADILNNGAANQTSVALNAVSGTYDETGPAIPLNSAASDTLEITVPFMLSNTIGDYNVDVTTVISGTDSDATNNTKQFTIRRDAHLYARDNGDITGAISQVSNNDGNEMSIGNVMEIFDPIDVYSMQVRLVNQSTAVGQEFFGEIEIFDGTTGEFTPVDVTESHIVVNGDLNNFVTLHFTNGPLSFSAGDAILVLAHHYGGTNEIGFGYAQPTFDQSVLGYTYSSTPATRFALTDPNAIMIRLNDLNDLGVAENEAQFELNVFPNPATEQTKVSFKLNNASDVAVSVSDLAGKVVFTENTSNAAAGQHEVSINTANLAAGVYTVNFAANNTIVTKKLVVRK